MDGVAYQRALGRELQQLRMRRRWTRAQLVQRLPNELSAQALASYETGTRSCTVVRFVQLCTALEASPHDLLERVHDQVSHEEYPASLKVDLTELATDPRPELAPARRWAATEVARHAASTRDLDIGALESLAALCGLSTVELVRMLRSGGKVEQEQVQ
ncbi:DNA-binding Xre family transcriptional regulator [Actinokineospora baliensis]|uniref:helix-turn-helix domain-containing protein n=1 Tax=Actinokineospora baliensis TaxID=547056 RepID=UPI00195BF21C|nr:helix-turn-helix transcriptional regulator [Actinokineospora baliensis]MBM7772312.1 DNA-binding Xre family transcriptional regulator [Actinokineospora baliensis]